MTRFMHGCVVLAAALLTACASTGAEPPAVEVKREFSVFQNEVYPVLLRDCGFPACHGAKERFFRVFGPGRTRLPDDRGVFPEAFDLATGKEFSTSQSLALAMIDRQHPDLSLLLRKPLAISAGGAGHLGVDGYGRDVYRTAEDAGFLTLVRWVHAAPATGATTP